MSRWCNNLYKISICIQNNSFHFVTLKFRIKFDYQSNYRTYLQYEAIACSSNSNDLIVDVSHFQCSDGWLAYDSAESRFKTGSITVNGVVIWVFTTKTSINLDVLNKRKCNTYQVHIFKSAVFNRKAIWFCDLAWQPTTAKSRSKRTCRRKFIINRQSQLQRLEVRSLACM